MVPLSTGQTYPMKILVRISLRTPLRMPAQTQPPYTPRQRGKIEEARISHSRGSTAQ
jgi:hypothetical protein